MYVINLHMGHKLILYSLTKITRIKHIFCSGVTNQCFTDSILYTQVDRQALVVHNARALY